MRDPPAGDPQPRGQRLEQDRHQVRQQDHAQERVAVFRAAGEVGRPVSRIHVADRDEVAGARKGEELAPETAADGDGNRAVDFRKTERTGDLTPTVRPQIPRHPPAWT